jgi:hypothetical protein
MKNNKSLKKPAVVPSSGVSGRTLHSLLALAAENRSEKIPAAIARAVANTMQAEICFLISIPDAEGNITVFQGFNLPAEEILHGGLVSSTSKPALADKLKTSQPYWNNDLEDVSGFIGKRTDKVKATVCMCPLITTQNEPIGGIILLSPFSHRVWNRQDLVQLTAMVDTITRILQRVDYVASLEEKLTQAIEQHTEKPDVNQLSQLPQKSDDVKSRILTDTAKNSLPAGKMTADGERSGDQSRAEIEQGKIHGKVSDLIDDFQKVNSQPNLAAANPAPATGGPYAVANDMSETDSMRSAISAIAGYIQLLKSEAAGPLTPMQKKFLERVHVSAGKINQALTSLEKNIPLATGKSSNQNVMFNPLIKDVLFEFGTLIDQKEIKVELAIPKNLPSIVSNKDNITKILRNVFSSILFEAPSSGKLVILLKSVSQVKSKGGILCSIISVLQGADIKPPYIPGESDYRLGNDVSGLLSAVNGQVWVNQSIHQEKTVHLFFTDYTVQ